MSKEVKDLTLIDTLENLIYYFESEIRYIKNGDVKHDFESFKDYVEEIVNEKLDDLEKLF